MISHNESQNLSSLCEFTGYLCKFKQCMKNIKMTIDTHCIDTIISRQDSGLEAFSHNLTYGSFGSLTFQLNPLPEV